MLKNIELLEEKLIAMIDKFDRLSKLCKVLSVSSYSKIVKALDSVKEKYITEYETIIQYDENEDILWCPSVEEKKYQLIEERAIKGMTEVKSLAISEKIDDIYYICKVIFKNDNDERFQKLKKMKNSLFETDKICLDPDIIVREYDYEGINKFQNGIISDLLEIEDVVNFPENRLRIIKAGIENIKQSENFTNFNNVEEELRNVERLKNILKSYIPYKNPKEIEKIKYEIISLKFEILIRMQVERLIYQNGNENNCLLEYDDEEEKQIFKELLEEKKKSLVIGKINSVENDSVLSLPIDRIYENTALLKRLLVIDMERNSYEYINLLKAPIFNAHLCNIANDPFKPEIELVKSEDNCMTKKINFSLLKSILPLITNKNISIAECENIYRKFGFECNPLLFNIGQKCIKMIYDKVKHSIQCETILENSKKPKKKDEKYCAIVFDHFEYSFEDKKNSRNLLSENLDEETLKVFYTEDTQKEMKKVREEGSLTTNIDIIISLLLKASDTIEGEFNEIEGKKSFMYDKYAHKILEKFCYNMGYKDQATTELTNLKKSEISNARNLQLEDLKILLEVTKYIYDNLNIKYNAWEIVPLEDLYEPQVKLVTSTDEFEKYNKKKVSSWWEDPCWEDDYDIVQMKLPHPLIEKYGKDINELGIELKAGKKIFETVSKEKIFNDVVFSNVIVKLDDISDLPIDYDKIKLISREEIEKDSKMDDGR